MDPVLLYLIVLLSVAICALVGFWFYREGQARKKRVRPPPARRAVRHDRWEGAVRASRDKV